MHEDGDATDRGKENGEVPQIYRIRRNEAVGLVSLPVLVAIIGLLVSVIFNLFTGRERIAKELRQEISYGDREQTTNFRREIDKLESKTDKINNDQWNRIRWLEQKAADWSARRQQK